MKLTKASDIKAYKDMYQNKWVALDTQSHEVLAYNTDLKKLSRELKGLKQEFTLEKVLPLDKVFIP